MFISPRVISPQASIQERTIAQQSAVNEVKHNIAAKQMAKDQHLLHKGKVKPERFFNTGDLVMVFDAEDKRKMSEISRTLARYGQVLTVRISPRVAHW